MHWLLARLLLTALLLSVLPFTVRAQEGGLPRSSETGPDYRFRRLAVADGLPERFVRVMFQDSRGFLWIGTKNGIARYDGRSMDVIRPAPGPMDPAVQYITALFEDASGNVWASGDVDGGIARYDRATEQWTFFRHDPANANSLSSSNVQTAAMGGPNRVLAITWVDSLGYCLDRIDMETGLVRRFRYRGNSGDRMDGACFSFMQTAFASPVVVPDHDGTSWIRTGGGLIHFDAERDTLRFYASSGPRYDATHLDVLNGRRPLASILQVRDREERTASFHLARPADVVLVGLGEMFVAPDDFGWLVNADGDTVWTMDRRHSAWAGGGAKNRMVVARRTLPAGRYRLTYRSDFSHSFGAWNAMPPDRPDLWGVQVHLIDSLDSPIPITRDLRSLEAPLPSGPVSVVYVDRLGQLWVGTDGDGLCRFARQAGVCADVFRHDPGDATSLPSDAVLSIGEDRDGRLWIGTDRGLALFRAGRFVRYPVPSLGPRRSTASPEEIARSRNTIRGLLSDAEGALWLRTTNSFLRFDPATGEYAGYEHDPNDETTPTGGPPSVLLLDRQNTLWAGTTGGLNRVERLTERIREFVHDPTNEQGLSGNYLYGMVESADGSVLIGSNGGINRFDPSTERFSRPDLEIIGEKGPYTVPFLIDSRRRLWVTEFSTQNRFLNVMDAGGRIVKRLRVDASDTTTLKAHVRLAVEDHDGNIWLGTGGAGLYRFDPEITTLVHYPYTFGPPPGDLDGALDDDQVSSLLVDREGRLWVGTNNGGLNLLDPSTGRFTSFWNRTMGMEGIIAIHEDRDGRLWLGSYVGGLILFDRENGTVIRRYDESDGLLGNSGGKILEDDEGRLWLGTHRGIVRFDPETETFRVFGADDGLSTSDFMASSLCTRNGLLIFGGETAFAVLDPAELGPNLQPPVVTLDAVTSRNVGSGETLRYLVRNDHALRLGYDRNDLTFHFNGIDFVRPDGVRLRYRLSGYDETWSDGGVQSVARYTNLPPGEFVFELSAANIDHVWSEPATVQLAIMPPWWRMPWAYLLYVATFVAGIFGVDRVQRKRVLRKEREATRERELAQKREIEQAYHQLRQAKDRLVQQEKLASLGQLTAGIAHEIKNPLNFINNFASLSVEMIEEVTHEPDVTVGQMQEYLTDLKLNAAKITEHGRRVDGIVRSMLDHSRGSKGDRAAVDVNELVDEYVNLAFHGMRARHADFAVTIHRRFGPGVGEVELVPQEIGRVLINILNNAFQAVHEQQRKRGGEYEPAVVVSTARDGDQVDIRIADNGPGIPASLREKIFEPFFTTKPAGEGTGLGLSLCFEIVNQGHGGEIILESVEGKGATFVIVFPANG